MWSLGRDRHARLSPCGALIVLESHEHPPVGRIERDLVERLDEQSECGRAPAAIGIVTLRAGTSGLTHAAVMGFVWHIPRTSGRVAAPVSTEAVIDAPAPTLDVATTNPTVPFTPGTCAIPSPLGVAPSAMMSGTGVLDADSSRVLSPTVIGAGALFRHWKVITAFSGEKGCAASCKDVSAA